MSITLRLVIIASEVCLYLSQKSPLQVVSIEFSCSNVFIGGSCGVQQVGGVGVPNPESNTLVTLEDVQEESLC